MDVIVNDRSEPGHWPPPSTHTSGEIFRLQHCSCAVSPGNSSNTDNNHTPLRFVPLRRLNVDKAICGTYDPMNGAAPRPIGVWAESSKVVSPAGTQLLPKFAPNPPSFCARVTAVPFGLISCNVSPESNSAATSTDTVNCPTDSSPLTRIGE